MQHLPKSKASEKGLSLGEMFKDVGMLGGVVISLMPALFFSQTMMHTPATVPRAESAII